MMDLKEILELVEAPVELVEWAPEELAEAVRECPRGCWLVWIMGTTGLPLEHLVAATAEVVREALDANGVGLDSLVDAIDASLDLLDGTEDGDECLAIADECEALAADPPVSYRTGGHPSFAELAMAASWVARAADGYEAASARLRAQVEAQASHIGATVGAAGYLFLPEAQGLVFDADQFAIDRSATDVLYVVAALASAVAHVEQAAALGDGPGADDPVVRARTATARQLREMIAFRE